MPLVGPEALSQKSLGELPSVGVAATQAVQ